MDTGVVGLASAGVVIGKGVARFVSKLFPTRGKNGELTSVRRFKYNSYTSISNAVDKAINGVKALSHINEHGETRYLIRGFLSGTNADIQQT